jgi:hypothetical protein
MRRYKDDILCDVVPIHVAHLLLRRPWQFDRKSKHDSFQNRYMLEKNGKTYMFMSLSPIQVYKVQLKLKKVKEVKHVLL